MNKLDLEKLRENPNRTLLMIANELIKLFENEISKKEVVMFKDKTSRLILAYLSMWDGATQHELVKATQMKGSTVSVAITKMENEGYVKRVQDEYDMRATRVYITKKGLEISTEHKRLLDSIDSSLMTDISERDIRVARYVLEKMLDNLIEN
ncbi:MAG: winged helix-turn-helix transcriptional regulator [Ruminococcaceae bacterium]|nr:winged helix-turn-helix transcriptional regulator [Oscillospiraceae bacterium]